MDPKCHIVELSLLAHVAVHSHTIDLKHMVQINNKTGTARKVRRNSTAAAARDNWKWFDDDLWKPYDPAVCGQLEDAHQTGRKGTTIHTAKWSYWVDFERGVQVNCATNKERKIRREASSAGAKTDAAGLAKASVHAAGVGASPGASAGNLPWRTVFNAAREAVDLARVVGWAEVAPHEIAAGETDPVMFTPLGEDGETVVRLPCHTEAVPCTFNRSTLEAAFRTTAACPTCGVTFGLPGPQPSGTMSARKRGFDCDGHPGVGALHADSFTGA